MPQQIIGPAQSSTQVTTAINTAVPNVNSRMLSEARTASADGTGTGTISANTDFVVVTSAGVDNIIVLPTPTPKVVVRLRNGATGYELRSSAPATGGINGGVGAAAESAIAANTYVVCECDTATSWICTQYTTAGVASAVQVAAP
jgi:hypothetical protein